MHYSENDFFTADHGKLNGRRACIVKHKDTGVPFIIYEPDAQNSHYTYDLSTHAPTDPQLREALEKAADTYFSTHK
ncbi:hypothetical protein [Selenomonas sp. FC4001]|uniref:hypothetical protein n=1 Tax=Selenomonas sp. FC4001 TaxID=1408313 RepID=UPI0012DC39A2|nr:hypothetical protein [Selenomonas sp. FC4001]